MWQRATAAPPNAHHLQVELDYSALHRNTTALTQNSLHVSTHLAMERTRVDFASAVPRDSATQPLCRTAPPHQACATNCHRALQRTVRRSTTRTASAETKIQSALVGLPAQGDTAMEPQTRALKCNSTSAKRQSRSLGQIHALAFVMPPQFVVV